MGGDVQCVEASIHMTEGVRFQPGDCLADIQGEACSILQAKRAALNLVQPMSVIATLTSRYAAAAASTSMRIIDTRKTIAGF